MLENKYYLCGLDDHLIDRDTMLHRQIIEPLHLLQEAATVAGFNLTVASAYRSFERQLSIWNAKAEGRRVVLDSAGLPVDMMALDPWQQVQAILRWSALPGASRHHWGTDLDIYDKKCCC